MLTLRRLVLTDFRNYARMEWRPEGALPVIVGANGTGKTNLLEALSLLAPGRGFRGAALPEFPRAEGPGGFAVAARFADAAGAFSVATGMAAGAASRTLLLDGEAATRAAVAARLPVLWLTPQMERLFQEAAGGRRRFLDRLVGALEPSHAREVAAHEAAVANRNRLLTRGGGADPAWLAATEDSLARHAVAVTAARRAAIAALNATAAGGFPRARLALVSPVADLLDGGPALAAEARVREWLAGSRGRDAQAGATSVGAHRADVAFADADTARPAARASTGEQKALLVGLVLAHAALAQARTGVAPVLLLDEPLVHLDEARRAALFAAVRARGATTLMTGTDEGPFGPLGDTAGVWTASGGGLSRGCHPSQESLI